MTRRFIFGIGDEVKLGTGTVRFPVAQRYQGRFGTITSRRREGKSNVYEVSMGSRRATPLVVTQTQLS